MIARIDFMQRAVTQSTFEQFVRTSVTEGRCARCVMQLVRSNSLPQSRKRFRIASHNSRQVRSRLSTDDAQIRSARYPHSLLY